MMTLALLLGIPAARGGGPGPHFWPRALLAGTVFLILLAVLDRLFSALPRSRRRRGGGGGGRRRALPQGAMLLMLAPESSTANDAEPEKKDPPPTISIHAGLETFYSWNFNRPPDGITAFRGFDARHDTFALSNAVVDTRWNAGAVSGRVALQAGETPDIYYGAEASSDIRHILEATLSWRAPLGRGLTFDGGVFLSPIGPEGMLVKDNWTWSRSTLFFALPFYHAGVRATYAASEHWNLTAAVYNGWNNLTDTNGRKSLSMQALYTKPDAVTASLLYFGGVERPNSAPEGQPWRHLFDAHLTAAVSPRVSVQVHADAGFESTAFGRSSWRGAAVAVRIRATPWLFVAGRADRLDETVPASAWGRATALFFPTSRVHSLTATLDARPDDRLSARLEFRRDRTADPIYLTRSSSAPSATTQSTLTFGLTAWF